MCELAIGGMAIIIFTSLVSLAYGLGCFIIDVNGYKDVGTLKIILTGIAALTLLVLVSGLVGFIIKQAGALL